jgi:hypothetical protein
MPRMKDWLKLLNLGVTRSHFGCYAPPFRTAQWLNRFAIMEGGAALVALSWRRLHRARHQARQGHAPDRAGVEQEIGPGAASGAGNQQKLRIEKDRAA